AALCSLAAWPSCISHNQPQSPYHGYACHVYKQILQSLPLSHQHAWASGFAAPMWEQLGSQIAICAHRRISLRSEIASLVRPGASLGADLQAEVALALAS